LLRSCKSSGHACAHHAAMHTLSYYGLQVASLCWGQQVAS
jgi:hypothetical protein